MKLNISKTTEIKKGFTLIETMVAITILMIAIIGPMSIISRYFSDNNYARNQIIASSLAQEGAEMATNIIRNQLSSASVNACPDSNEWLVGGSSSLGDCVSSSGDEKLCDISPLNKSVTSCTPGTGSLSVVCQDKLYQNSDGLYLPGTDGAASIFSRGIKIEDITHIDSSTNRDVPLEARITSSVSWDYKGESTPVAETTYIVRQIISLDCAI